MPPFSALRPGVVTGLIQLARWLGWTIIRFATLDQPPTGEATAVMALRDVSVARIPLPANGTPIAHRLRGTGRDHAWLAPQRRATGIAVVGLRSSQQHTRKHIPRAAVRAQPVAVPFPRCSC